MKAKCERHPRYNPEREGRGGIKGGCSTCFSLFDLHQARLSLDAAHREFLRRALIDLFLSLSNLPIYHHLRFFNEDCGRFAQNRGVSLGDEKSVSRTDIAELLEESRLGYRTVERRCRRSTQPNSRFVIKPNTRVPGSSRPYRIPCAIRAPVLTVHPVQAGGASASIRRI